MRAAARPYEDVVVAAPVTVPYTRHSIHSAHWFLAQALAKLIKAAGIRKSDIDGLAVSSFTLAPDTAVGFTQHVGLSPRFLEHVPMGGASAIVQLRRAARAVEAGDAQIVACIAGDANHVDSFRLNTASFSRSRVTPSTLMARAARTAASRSSPPITCVLTARGVRITASSVSRSGRTRFPIRWLFFARS